MEYYITSDHTRSGGTVMGAQQVSTETYGIQYQYWYSADTVMNTI